MPKPFRVFISAVSSECAAARAKVASDLRARGFEVKVQDDFRQEADTRTTLEKLHRYISECDAVVSILGKRSGAFPPDMAAQPFAQLLPEGFSRLSYTQWEVAFARMSSRRLSFYVLADDFIAEGEPNSEDEPAGQARFADWLFRTCGLDRVEATNKDELRAEILREDWPQLSQPKFVHPRFQTIGSLFKGREADMARLRDLLSKGATAIGSRTPAIHGLGGIGKTRLALEYGLAHQKDYDALIFLSGETPDQLQRDIIGLVGALRIPGLEGQNEQAQVAAALDWLKAHPRWFLVIDNLDTPEALKAADALLSQLASHQDRRGDIVITTRLTRFDARFQKLDLDVLTIEAASTFLLARTAADRETAADDTATAQAIATDLGQLSLALEQAGAQIATMGWSLRRYRKEWESNREKALAFWDDSVTAYPHAVAQTWATSVIQLSEAAQAVMRLIAVLAPEPVPKKILETPVADSGIDAELAVAELRRFSLVSFSGDAATFQMHRLVQEVTRAGMSEAERRSAVDDVVSWLSLAIGDERPILVPPYALSTILAEYANPSQQFLDGALREAKPQSGRESLLLPAPFGRTEFIYSQHSEPLTVPFADGIAEKGIREFTWRLHLPEREHEAWVGLVKAGFGDFDEPLELNGVSIKPVDFLDALIRRNVARNAAKIPRQEGHELHLAIGEGEKDGRKVTINQAVFGGPAVARPGYIDPATSIGMSIGIQLFLKTERRPGVWGPEEYFEPKSFLAELERRGFVVVDDMPVERA
jgi:hypothetical protein